MKADQVGTVACLSVRHFDLRGFSGGRIKFDELLFSQPLVEIQFIGVACDLGFERGGQSAAFRCSQPEHKACADDRKDRETEKNVEQARDCHGGDLS